MSRIFNFYLTLAKNRDDEQTIHGRNGKKQLSYENIPPRFPVVLLESIVRCVDVAGTDISKDVLNTAFSFPSQHLTKLSY